MIRLLVLLFLVTSCSSVLVPVTKNPDQRPLHLRWAFDLDPEYMTGNLPIGLQAPLANEGLVFVGHNKGEMRAYSLSSGRPLWSALDQGAYHAAPVRFGDDIIYGTAEGRVFARHFLTGELHYSVDLGAPIESEGIISGGRIFFQLRNHQIFALDASTGKILWGYKRPMSLLTTLQRVSSPTIDGTRLFVGFADGSLAALSIEDGSLLWDRKLSTGAKFLDVDVRPVLWNKMLLAGPQGGALMAFDPLSGQLLHQVDIKLSRLMASEHNDFLLVGDIHGDLMALDQKLNIIKRVNVTKEAITSLLYWKKNLVVGTSGAELLLLNTQDFNQLGEFNLGHKHSSVLSMMSESEGKLAVLSARNRLYIFE